MASGNSAQGRYLPVKDRSQSPFASKPNCKEDSELQLEVRMKDCQQHYKSTGGRQQSSSVEYNQLFIKSLNGISSKLK